MDLRHIFNLKKTAVVLISAVFLSLTSFNVYSQESAEGDSISAAKVEHGQEGKKEESISETILHHIADSHEWHFWGHDEHKVALPLPVLLWTNNGLVSFLYNKHDKDEHAKTVFTENGQNLVNFQRMADCRLHSCELVSGNVDRQRSRHQCRQQLPRKWRRRSCSHPIISLDCHSVV